MKKLFSVALLLGLIGVAHADGTNGTSTTTVTTASTKVADASDVKNGRHYIFLQNLSATNTVNCTIGVSAGATTTTGIALAATASWVAFGQLSPSNVALALPTGEIDCISSATTSPVTVITY